MPSLASPVVLSACGCSSAVNAGFHDLLRSNVRIQEAIIEARNTERCLDHLAGVWVQHSRRSHSRGKAHLAELPVRARRSIAC